MERCEKCFELYDDLIAFGVCPHCGYYEGEQQDDPSALPIGSILHDQYVIGGVLGVGGFGITYRAWDKKHGVVKAIKEYFQQGVVNRSPGDTQVFVTAQKREEEFRYGRARLLTEARTVAKFQSRFVVRVDDYFEENNTSYMVMEYLNYQTLEDYLIARKAPLDEAETVRIGVSLCEALEEINGTDVIHRDISPDNIFVGVDGTVKIIDFGSARLSKEDVDSSLIAIKQGYAPPEQYEPIDPNHDMQRAWTDVYALGATLYLAVTGRVPAEASDRKADYDNHTDRVCYPNEINPNIPEYLSNAIMTAMAINIHERFQNSEEFKQALQQEREVVPVEVARKRKKRRRTVGISAGVAVVCALGILFGVNLSRQHNDVVLPATEISVWYSESADKEQAEEKNAAMQSILEAAYDGDTFQNVTIHLNPIPELEYDEALKQAMENGTTPAVYECTELNAEYLTNAQGIQAVIDGDTYLQSIQPKKSCSFIETCADTLREGKWIPIGFDIPVVYLNKHALAEGETVEQISSMEQLMALDGGEMKYKPMSVSTSVTREAFASMLPDFSTYADAMEGIESFLSQKTVACFGSTGDYYQVSKALPGEFVMIPVATDNVVCSFRDFWCVGADEEIEREAAEAFLSFLLSNNAQDRYYNQTHNPGLPLDKMALDAYTSVERYFEVLFEGDPNFTVEAYLNDMLSVLN